MGKGIIIAGFAGVGKTTFANKYNNVVDLEIMDFKWIYNEEINNIEKKKGYMRKKRKEEWPYNYFEAIQKARFIYDIVLISTDNEILNLLNNNNLDYIISYPSANCKEEYLQRYKKRGNVNEFIKNVCETFDELIEELDSIKCEKIILNDNEYLEDKLKILKYLK